MGLLNFLYIDFPSVQQASMHTFTYSNIQIQREIIQYITKFKPNIILLKSHHFPSLFKASNKRYLSLTDLGCQQRTIRWQQNVTLLVSPSSQVKFCSSDVVNLPVVTVFLISFSVMRLLMVRAVALFLIPP